MNYLIRKLYKYLGSKKKLQIFCLFLLMLLSGLAELVSTAAIIPFLTFLIKPEEILRFKFINFIWEKTGIINSENIVLFIIFGFACLALISSLVRIINLYFTIKLGASIGEEISYETFKISLNFPFSKHQEINSANLLTTVTNFSSLVADSVHELLRMVSSIVISICLLAGILIFNWKLTIFTFLTFIFAYCVLLLRVQKTIRKIGTETNYANKKSIKIIQESFGAIRDIILDGNQDYFANHYRKQNKRFRYGIAKHIFLTTSPRIYIETFGIITIAVLPIIIFGKENIGEELITTLGTMALFCQKLLPQYQQIYASWSLIIGNKPSIKNVFDILDLSYYKSKLQSKNLTYKFQDKIEIKNLSYKYPHTQNYIFKNINISFRKGSIIGIVGKTGSGKSTLVDILMGLIKPTYGEVLVDRHSIYNNDYNFLLNWRSIVAHVPQEVFLIDGTIAENIALGYPKSQISLKKIKDSADNAQLSNLISKRRNAYQTKVGERGIKLSGGQKQRIGIARALYKNSKILFLDEATSALDSKTEEDIMKTIYNLSNDITIFIIAHRKSTLKHCHQIIEIFDGEVNLLS